MCKQIILINNLLVILLFISGMVTLLLCYNDQDNIMSNKSYISFIIFLIITTITFVFNCFIHINTIINVNTDNSYPIAA
jgi:hypothetical protein